MKDLKDKDFDTYSDWSLSDSSGSFDIGLHVKNSYKGNQAKVSSPIPISTKNEEQVRTKVEFQIYEETK